MSKHEPFFEAIKKAGRTIEEQLRRNVMATCIMDYFFFKVVEREYGTEKATAICKKKWANMSQGRIGSVKDALGIKEVTDIPTLGRISQYRHEVTPCPYKIVEDKVNRHIGYVLLCPYLEYVRDIFGEEVGSPYFKYVAEASKDFVARLPKEAGLKEVIGVQDKYMCLSEDDDVCRVLFEYEKDSQSDPTR